jgi:hypothetical protein
MIGVPEGMNPLSSADRDKWDAIHRLMNPNAPRLPQQREERSGNRAHFHKGGFKKGGFKGCRSFGEAKQV